MAVFLFSLVPLGKFASAMYGTKIIDGSLNDWKASDLIATGQNSGLDGANLDRLYVSWDEQYLYIAIKTNNTQSWDVAYGIGIDIDPGTGSGYTSGGDSWGRSVEFSGGFAPDYEIYFWWSKASGMGAGNFNTWAGSGWDNNGISSVGGSFAYTGDTTTGLQTIEIKIPWSALGGKPDRIAVMAWITGSGGSAVDSLPADQAIDYANIGNEWGDTDTFTSMAVVYVAPKTIDGNLSDWSENELAAEDTTGTGTDMGNLSRFYVSWDDQYLYLAIETNNTKNGGMAYGFGIDIDPGTGNGYTAGGDAWRRSIEFSNGYALDYEVYFWWNDGKASITTAQLNSYNGGWNWPDLTDMGGKYGYTGDSSTGLKTLEVAIPWSAIGGMPRKFAVAAWVTGESGSAVDVLPQEGAAADNADEWGDTDVITEMSGFEMFIPVPELTISVTGPSVVGLNRTAIYNVTVKNLGSLPASGVEVKVYLNDTPLSNWTISLSAGEERELTFVWKPNETGRYILKATVDEDNLIKEANEDNNAFEMGVNVMWVGDIDVDGDPTDWPEVSLAPNSYTVQDGVFIWNDASGDQRTDKDQYLPGKRSSHADLTEVGVTKDDRYIYFLFKFRNMSNIKIGDNGATFIAVPIDYKDDGADWFAGQMDTKTVISWNLQMVINLCSDQHTGQTHAVAPGGSGLKSLLYFVNANGEIVPVEDSIIGVDLSKNTVEVGIPLEVFGDARTFRFQVATGFSYGEGVWNFGDPMHNDGISDIVDTISTENTADELIDNVPDVYITIKFNSIVESADVLSMKEVRERERIEKLHSTIISIGKYYGPYHFEEDYSRYTEIAAELGNMSLPEDVTKRLSELQNKVADLLKMYNGGRELMNRDAEFAGALKIYRAYTGLKKIVGEMEEILRKAQEGEYAREKYMEELAKNLTKDIDGNLNDWGVEPLAADDTGFGQNGANLKALYVDYDDRFLYIALTTENKASWRVSYGIALDYRDGGYTTGTDAWGRKVSFTGGVDAQLYFFWNGEFFGDKGTGNITSAQLALWNGTAWKYEDLKWVGFYAYTGGAENGLQTLEIAIPWTAIGGEPEKLRIVAYVTGQGGGDSAVDVLPLQDAVKDNAPGDEWGDADTFSEFAVVTIE
nr:CARDB domain-containing protein [Thermococcus sp. 21S7]